MADGAELAIAREPAADARPALVAGATLLLATLCLRGGSPALATLVLATCALSWALCPLVAALALRCGASASPGGRAVHAERTPLLGGLALFAPIACAALWAGGPRVDGLLAGSAVVLLAGAWDDLRGLGPKGKLAAQCVAALMLVADGCRITGLGLEPLGTLSMDGFEAAAVVAWIVLVTNAVNLIDGVDGLAATLVLVAALALAALGPAPALALGLAGACLGFLRHNLPRARIFLGDTGSLLLGFHVGALALAAPGPVNVAVAAGLLLIPIGDLGLCVARRWMRAKPLFAADRGHVHHLLLRLWGESPRVLLGLGALAAAQAAAIWLRPDLWGLLVSACLWGAAMAYVVSRIRPDWPRIVLHRRAFRRIHLARSYARGALPLCDGPDEVRAVLERVVQDLDLRGAALGGMRIDRGRASPARGAVAGERFDCGGVSATWTAAAERGDPALLEEKRAVMCELMRDAAERLRRLGAPADARGPGDAAPARPVHCVVDDLRQLEGLAQGGCRETVVVYVGRREDLRRPGRRPEDLGLAAPVVCLGVPPDPEPDGDRVLRTRVRYGALLARHRPAAAVVMGGGPAAAGCAMAARACGVGVLRIDGPADAAGPRAAPRGAAARAAAPGPDGEGPATGGEEASCAS